MTAKISSPVVSSPITAAALPVIARGSDPDSIARDFLEKLFFQLAKFPGVATRNDLFLALAYTVRDRVLERWVQSARTYLRGKHKTVLYLSAEYLIGPQLGANLLSLGIEAEVRSALAGLGVSLDELVAHEEEPGLGNGGLGRLAACFVESLSSLRIPAIGHGLRYEFGIFDQEIVDGFQVERTDRWLRHGNPWEIRRFDIEHRVGFGGYTEVVPNGRGGFRVVWHPERVTMGVAYDTPIPGYAVSNANFLRLWRAVADEELDLVAFQAGDYQRAVDAKIRSENITKVLYPNDRSAAGKALRLEQQAFFVSSALQDAIRILLQVGDVREFADKFVIQLNDTHPALAVAELMRLLVDVQELSWDEAWEIVSNCVNFTNHTLMPEALETWPLDMFGRLLPRHLEIVFEINRRFLAEVSSRYPGDEALVRRLSLIDETGRRSVRMVNLATVASKHVNGVSALHSRLVQDELLPDFKRLYPDRFVNVTNGVNPRRFVALANPGLSALLSDALGRDWLTDFRRLEQLEAFAADAAFQERFRAIKLENKRALARWLEVTHKNTFDPAAQLDAQCKRFHEYKRQHLNLLNIIACFAKLRDGIACVRVPRTFLFAGKAAPDYWMAKLMIRLVHGVAEAVQADPRTRELIRVVFVPDFNVKVAQGIYPAADLSEQISTAGTEASGTGNMKFALNGALTIGTLDGANLEIREAVGASHFFEFGLSAEEASAQRRGRCRSREYLDTDPELARALELIANGTFSHGDRALFAPLIQSLVESDPFLVLPDFQSYAAARARAEAAFLEQQAWTHSSILNVARSGRFSSDRAIEEYRTLIWGVAPADVPLPEPRAR